MTIKIFIFFFLIDVDDDNDDVKWMDDKTQMKENGMKKRKNKSKFMIQ